MAFISKLIFSIKENKLNDKKLFKGRVSINPNNREIYILTSFAIIILLPKAFLMFVVYK